MVFCISTLSAQTKTAYCDVYVRGGGKNMKITLMYNNNNTVHCNSRNIGDILNVLAADRWVLDREIVIPRHPIFSMFTRHKLHLIMKKEYYEGEDPFSFINRGSRVNTSIYHTNVTHETIVYQGIKAVAIKIEDNKVILVAMDSSTCRWHEAKLYCQSLGYTWKMPSTAELQKIRTVLCNDPYWTIEEVNERQAKSYNRISNRSVISNKATSRRVQPIAIVNISELE